MKKLNSIELFAGAGGLALGMELSGFNHVALIENNKWAAETLLKNRNNWNVLCKDIKEITNSGVLDFIDEPSIDLVSGGYPCQAFSYAGKKLGLEDTRGTLFYHFAEIVKETNPKMFIAENVKGLVSHDSGNTLNTMLEVFRNLGYRVNYKVLSSLDYSVAQKRDRIFIVGVRKDIEEKIGEPFSFPEPHDKKLMLKDILLDVPESPCGSYSENKKKVLELVKPGGCWRDLPDDIAKEYMGKSYYLGGGKTGIARRLSWDEPSLTVLCSPSQKQTERCHPDEIRPFSVRENARIQSFPDEWIFEGPVSEQYKQIGNAVPVNLAKAVGEEAYKYLSRLEGE